MKFEGGLNYNKGNKESSSHENKENFTPEILRQKISDPFWLADYKVTAKIIDSYTDQYGTFLSEDEEDKWFKFLKDKETPVFEIWTKEYITRFSDYLSKRVQEIGGSKDNPLIVLEVGAGNGKFSYFLQQKLDTMKNDMIKIITTGSETKSFSIQSPYKNVEQIDEKEALEKYKPTIIICSWMMYGEDWTKDFRKTDTVKEYILIGPEEPCGTDETWYEWNEGFQKKEFDDLSDVQISRLDILCAPTKTGSEGFITKTTSFKKETRSN